MVCMNILRVLVLPYNLNAGSCAENSARATGFYADKGPTDHCFPSLNFLYTFMSFERTFVPLFNVITRMETN